jgi:hypothetical protein
MLSTQGISINIVYYSSIFDYQVVIIKHNHKSHMNIGEMTLLWNDWNKQVSLMSEGFTDIQINLHLARKKSDNTTHMSNEGTMSGHSSWQRSKSWTGSHLSLVHVFHTIAHTGLSVGDLYTIPVYITAPEVRDRPTRVTVKATKFTRPHKSYMHQYIIKLAHRG